MVKIRRDFILKKIITLAMAIVIMGVYITGCSFKTTQEIDEIEENFPDKEITIVIPWPSGGFIDIVASEFAQLLGEKLEQTVTVINKEGASGAIGTSFVYDRASDGYTLLFSTETLALFRVMGLNSLGFDDFTPLKMLAHDFKVVVVPENSKYNTFKELIDDIKVKPGKVSMSYSGPGTSGYIQGLLLKKIGINAAIIPYDGEKSSMAAAIDGEVDFTFLNYSIAKDSLKSKKLRILATFTEEKIEELKDIPSVVEIVPDMTKYIQLYFPNVLLVKKDTPENVKDALIDSIEEVIDDPRWREFIDDYSYTALDHLTTEEIEEYWNQYTSITSWLLYDTGSIERSPEEFGINRP